MKLKHIILHIFCLVTTSLIAQQNKKGNSIFVIGYSQPDSNQILLRWGVGNYPAWQNSNKYGYKLERFTISLDKKMLEIPEAKVLETRIAPAPLTAWEQLAKQDSYAAIIAQALYGEHFETDGNDAKGLTKIMNLSQEQEQRYLFSMYAADMSFAGARKAG